MPKRRRGAPGLFPWLVDRLVAIGPWVMRHPQPFVVMALLAAGSWALSVYAQQADAFRVTQVFLPAQSSLTLTEPVIGRNMWQLDIQALSRQLEREQPSLKYVQVIRELPNAIRIEAVPRVPVGQVRLGQWYPVDAEGFVLPKGSPESDGRLVRFVGFERAAVPLQAGKLNRDERLALAMRLRETLKRSPVLRAHRVTTIDVGDPQHVQFVLDEETAVRCGSEAELGAQLERLRTALKAVGAQRVAVQYIDVRFREPVLGPAPAGT